MRFTLFDSAFWGIFLIILGGFAILKNYVHINISLPRFALAILLIYIGLVVLTGGYRFNHEPNMAIFETRTVTVTQPGEYTVLFGSATYLLEGLENGGEVEVNAIFGSATVIIPTDMNVRVQLSSAFGSATTPDGASTWFGERNYNYNRGDGQPELRLTGSAVFGSISVVGR